MHRGSLVRLPNSEPRPSAPRRRYVLRHVTQCLAELNAKRDLRLDLGQSGALLWARVHGVAMLDIDGTFGRTKPVTRDALLDALLGHQLTGVRLRREGMGLCSSSWPEVQNRQATPTVGAMLSCTP